MLSLTLSSSSTIFAVCQIPADRGLPPWATESQEFFSVTRTTDEISIVLPMDSLPQEFPPDTKVDSNWKMIKVIGAIDSSRTGITTELTTPLTQASIDTFSIGTYNTEYVLVKSDNLQRATQILLDAGHMFQTPTAPRDGPATVFQVEPFLAHLVQTEQTHEPTFSLVLAAGWPSSETLQNDYNRFKTRVEGCFMHNDTAGPDSPVYLYESSVLHITVASFHSIYHPIPSVYLQSILSKYALEVVEAATRLPQWPRVQLQLQIDRAQLGAKAGILLWDETTGGMEAIRDCIKQSSSTIVASVTENESMNEADRNAVVAMLRDIAIPGIVHSSFLRFWKEPETPGDVVQERLQSTVFNHLKDYFPDVYQVPSCRLVIEKTPCMHIPNDSDHVLFTIDIEGQQNV